jgi:membrane peptidoglycan carboxypeptidase
MTNGTGKMALLENMPCAGKTGTTNDNKDGWFVGYTRYYTTSVWVGYDMPRYVADLGGSTYPAQIWKAYMSTIHEGLEPMNFLPYAQLSPEFMEEHFPEEPAEGENSVEGEAPNEGENPGEGEEPNQGENPVEGDTPDEDE